MHNVINLGPWSVLVLPKSAWVSDEDLSSGLGIETRALIEEASSPARKDELLRSRWLIRNVLKQSEPTRGLDGDLEWQRGVCGSISHKQGHVVAAVSLLESDIGLGIDLERQNISEKIISRILTPSEVECLAALGEHAKIAAAGFAAKEALFKAIFPLTKQKFWFEDAEILEVKTRHDDDSITYIFIVKIGPAAGGPATWDRLCSVYLKSVVLDRECYWIAASGITNTVFYAPL